MIFVQNRQNVTRHDRSYGAERFGLFWAKRVILEP